VEAQRLERLRRSLHAMSFARLVAVPWIVIEVLTEEVSTVPVWGRGPGLWLAALLAAGGAVLDAATRRARTLRGARVVAVHGVILDSALVFGFVWLYASQPLAGMWAALYILPLEGAAFFALTGALATWGIISVGYAGLQVLASVRFDMVLSWNSVGFQLGVGFIISIIAGSLARSLHREREALEHELEERLRTEAELEERHRQLTEAREIARLGAWEWDLATNSVTWSEGVYEIHGLDPNADPDPERFLHLQHPADRERVRRVLERALQERATFSVDYRILRPDGRERFVRGKGETVVGPDGNAIGLFGTIQDITAQRAIEAALQHANTELQRSVDELEERNHQATLTASMGEMLLSCMSKEEASAVVRDFGQRMFPGSCGELAVVEDAALVAAASWPGERDGPSTTEPEACWALRRRQPHVVAAGPSVQRCAHLGSEEIASICVPLIAQGEALGVLTIGERENSAWLFGRANSSGRRLAQTMAEYVGLALANLNLRDELREQSLRDPLTGLFNRRYLLETLDRDLQRAERSETPLTLLAIDIDHFKEVNDSAGHAAGDAALREFGGFLAAEIRGSDIACRSGGDEFTVILTGATVEEATARAEQIRRGWAASRPPGDPQAMSLSIGVAGFPTHGSDAETLQHMADTALYKAKRAGRDRVVVCAGSVKPVKTLRIAAG
jgi:diguanylate cyclase (GGDEF)-like protein/PAS domain S-box-containing protein